MRKESRRDPCISHADPISIYPDFSSYYHHYSAKPDANGVLPTPIPFSLNNVIYFPKKALGAGAYGETWRFDPISSSANTPKLVLKIEKAEKTVMRCEQELKKPRNFTSGYPYPFNGTFSNFALRQKPRTFTVFTYNEGPGLKKEALFHKTLFGFGLFSGVADDVHSPHFVLMYFIPGITAKSLFDEFSADTTSAKQKAKISGDEIIRIWILIAAAFQHLHDHKIIHGDGNCNNLLIENRQKVRLIDFGLSFHDGEQRDDCDHPKMNHKHYPHLPPEKFLGEQVKMPRVYAHPSQDAYTVGFYLSLCIGFYYKRDSSPLKKCALQSIRNQLTDFNPKNRLAINNAIHQVITLFFPERMPQLIKHKHWQLMTLLILQTRFIKLSALSTPQGHVSETSPPGNESKAAFDDFMTQLHVDCISPRCAQAQRTAANDYFLSHAATQEPQASMVFLQQLFHSFFPNQHSKKAEMLLRQSLFSSQPRPREQLASNTKHPSAANSPPQTVALVLCSL